MIVGTLRKCPECGRLDDYLMTDGQWICHSCGHVEFPLTIELLANALARAAFVAEHLHAMIDADTWRASGADDKQGHYEGDFHSERIVLEITLWKELVNRAYA